MAPVSGGRARAWARGAARWGGGARGPAALRGWIPGRAGGLGRRWNTPAARERQEKPGTSKALGSMQSPGSTAKGTVKEKEDAAGKRGAGAG